jgi:hypothetical protein
VDAAGFEVQATSAAAPADVISMEAAEVAESEPAVGTFLSQNYHLPACPLLTCYNVCLVLQMYPSC